MKYRVKIKYALWHYEEYEVDTEGLEGCEDFKECPYDFCSPEDQTKNETGDILNGTWEESFEEICVLDLVVDALEVTDKS